MKIKSITTCLLCLFTLITTARPLVLLSIDGFKGDYISQYKPPFLTKLLAKSAYSTHMQPVFPSLTFPNHLSIVTGVYPAKHGIIANQFYHAGLHKAYSYQKGEKDGRLINREPIWIIAEKNHLKSAVYFWPESETPIHGALPTYYKKYIDSTPNKIRLRQIANWLTLPKNKRPDLVLGYFSTVDSAGHRYGPNSKEVKTAILKLDKDIADFFNDLKSRKLNNIDVIIVSDHGMTTVDSKHQIAIKSLDIPRTWHVENNHSQLYLYKNKQATYIKHNLEAKALNRYVVYEKGHYPDGWHLNEVSEAIPDLILNAKLPYLFYDSPFSSFMHGAHGFDPKTTPEMQAIFIANGPSFKPLHIKNMKNLAVMPVLLKLLGLKQPDYLDGKLNQLEKILQ